MPCRDTDHPDVARRPRREAGIPEVAVDVIVNSLPVGSCERFLEGLLLAPALGVTGDCPAGVRRRAAAQVVQAGCPADERPPAILGQVHPGSRDLGFLHVSPHGYSLLAMRVVPLTPAQLVPAHHGRPDDPPAAQQAMSARDGSSVTEVAASHSVYVSQPLALASLIK